MEITALGSGALLALAAVLWLVYLVPSWLRRHEYLATERNAVRLQQTLRVLAETTEIPLAVSTDTSARSVAAHQRSLRQQQQLTDAVSRAQAAAAARSHAQKIIHDQPALAHVVVSRSSAARRLRRTRAFTSLILVASLIIAVTQTALMVTTGVATAAPAVLTTAGIATIATFLFLGRLAAISRARARSAARVAVPVRRRTSSSVAPVHQQQPRIWTPVAVPKPLYLSRNVIEPPAFDQQSAVAGLHAAVAESDRALRSSRSAEISVPEMQPETGVATQPATQPAAGPTRVASPAENRFAAMGIVDTDTGVTPNLDDVLRRRRQAAS
jgi:hypothetical protein